ncbi:helicase [Oryctes borbonicus]|uniref:Helicase n=1 Tax=Oryctes borbonicus TaxID=1629725 RepID=A0A0T6B9F2_9SCAR|nr:helicase [Oryctes borbonicus]
MSANASVEALENVLENISKTKQLIEKSTVLHDSLKSISFDCAKDEIDSVEETKSIIDELSKNIAEYHKYFYTFYDAWKNEQKSSTGKDILGENGELICSKSPDIIDDSFNDKDDSVTKSVSSTTEEISADVAVPGSAKTTIAESNGVKQNNLNIHRKVENENKKDTDCDGNRLVESESHNKFDSDKTTNKQPRQYTTEIIQNIDKLQDKHNDKEFSPISGDHDSNNKKDKEGSDKISGNVDEIISDINIARPVSLNESWELNNLEADEENFCGSVNCGTTENNEGLDKESNTDLDPLTIENNGNTNDLKDKNLVEPDTVVPKEEYTFKIKCVDINKLLEVGPDYDDTESVEQTHINTSIVVISDSENESSSKKAEKKNRKLNAMLPHLGKEITLTRVKTSKKVKNSNDSDSNDDQTCSTGNSKVQIPNKNSEGNSRQILRSMDHPKMNPENVNPTRTLRRRSANNTSIASSLSENSTTRSNESEGEILQDRKKSKQKRRKKSCGNYSSNLNDKKFLQKTYVPLKRIPAEKLKENYEKILLKGEIEKLTNMENLKRSRRRDSKSSASTESDNAQTTKRHCSKKSKNNSSEKVSSSEESDVTMHTDSLKVSDALEDQLKTPEQLNVEEVLLEALLNNIESDDNKSIPSSYSEDKNNDQDGETRKNQSEENPDKVNTKDADKNLNSKDDINHPKDALDRESDSTKKKWRKDKLLTENITESDSDETFANFSKKRELVKEKDRLKKKRGTYVLESSDSDSSKAGRENSPDKTTSASESEKGEEETKDKKKASRRRIRKIQDSSDEEEEASKSTRKHIRKVWARGSLAETTIAAEKEEKERKARIAEKQKKYNLIFEANNLEKATVDKVVLDFNEKTEKELLKVDSRIVKYLKPHQARGIQFMWDTCFESLERANETKGSGCILAHCMGLGKTLQVIALTHTLITKEETGIRKVLIVCPLSTVLNWTAEFKKWLPGEDEVEVFELVSFKLNSERMYQVEEWNRLGGALVLGYDMFRNLTNPTNKRLNKKMRNTFNSSLVDPGPDLVICDEGHLLKNEKTSTSIAMNRVRTLRRIVLTGTPLQNNLKEYFCMVQFVKPNLLGTYKEYLNRFVNPITNGQYTDSTPHDINIMRKRSHVLHKLLDGVVQRKDYSVLAPFLPPKYEFVLFVSLTKLQIKLYEHYMREKSGQKDAGRGKSYLFVDFNEFQRICTHPRVLLDKSNNVKKNKDKFDILDDESEGSLKDFIDDEDIEKSTSSSSSSSSNSESDSEGSRKKNNTTNKRRATRATATTFEVSDDEKNEEEAETDPSEWWRQYCKDEDLDDIHHSGKLSLLFEILKQCEVIGDKVLIFSQSLYSLSVIEYFLNKIDEATQKLDGGSFCGFTGSWSLGLDYFRLDGSSSCDNRSAWCKTFNDPENTRARVFLISTRAGGLGINLVGANRVIVFDVSWNPSHDTQSIYRVYRFGQIKPSYIYRFVTLGTMEMKIYERQVTKQAISKRVIDEQQIDRHYNQSDLAELYKFEPVPEEERPTPLVPKDVLLGELLQVDKKIYKYHEHQSLLENKIDEVLDEEERKAAWEEFENEKKARSSSGYIAGYPVQTLMVAIQNIVRKENPNLPPTLIMQATNDMFNKLEEEITSGEAHKPILFQAVRELQALQVEQQQKYYEMLEQQRAMLQQFHQQQLLSQQMNR